MEAQVKYIHFADSGAKLGIGFRGTKIAHCVMNTENGIAVEEVPINEYDRMRVVPNVEAKHAAEQFMAFTRRRTAQRSITPGAQRLLERLLNGEGVELVATTPEEPKASDATPPSSTQGKGVLAMVCADLSLEPAVARRRLRAAGLHAPYDDEAKIRAALK